MSIDEKALEVAAEAYLRINHIVCTPSLRAAIAAYEAAKAPGQADAQDVADSRIALNDGGFLGIEESERFLKECSRQPVDIAAVAEKALLLAARWFKLNFDDDTLNDHPPSKADLAGMFDAMQEARTAINNARPKHEPSAPAALTEEEKAEAMECIEDTISQHETISGWIILTALLARYDLRPKDQPMPEMRCTCTDLYTCLPCGVKESAFGHEWQPIETAPKDGTFVLICGPHGLYIAQHQITYEGPEYRWKERAGFYNIEATHWMPLPKPPEAKERG